MQCLATNAALGRRRRRFGILICRDKKSWRNAKYPGTAELDHGGSCMARQAAAPEH